MDPLRALTPGSPLPRDAATWNGILAAARAHRSGRGGPPSAAAAAFPLVPATHCLVKYDESSTETLPAFSVVTYGGLLGDLADDPHGTGRRPAFVVGVPGGHADNVAVTVEPIAGQEVGRAVTSGLCVVTVDVTDGDHTRAIPVADETGYMASALNGGHPILAREGGTGEQLAVIHLGPVAGGAEDTAAAGPVSGSGTGDAGFGSTGGETATLLTLAAGTHLVRVYVAVTADYAAFSVPEKLWARLKLTPAAGGAATVTTRVFAHDRYAGSPVQAYFPVTLVEVLTLVEDTDVAVQTGATLGSSGAFGWSYRLDKISACRLSGSAVGPSGGGFTGTVP